MPPDGYIGRCRMYLWNTANPCRDRDLEAGIVVHELSHVCLATTIHSNRNYSDYAMGSWAANKEKDTRSYSRSPDETINVLLYKTLDEPGRCGVHAISEVGAQILWCTNPVYRYLHPSPVNTAESGIVLSNGSCKNGKDCKDKDCIMVHISPAVLNPNGITLCCYGAARTLTNCTFSYPLRPSSHHASVLCKFGAMWTPVTCPYQHPEGR
ncbi:hypothetical protein BD309DRAFT_1028341, partial [Dichomitus squalens]